MLARPKAALAFLVLLQEKSGDLLLLIRIA